MSAKLKSFLIISLKNAVNSVLVNAGLMAMFHNTFYLSGNWQGIEHLLQATGIVVSAREAMIWGPVIMHWSSTNADPSALDLAAATVEKESQQAASHAQAAQSAASDVKTIVADAKANSQTP